MNLWKRVVSELATFPIVREEFKAAAAESIVTLKNGETNVQDDLFATDDEEVGDGGHRDGEKTKEMEEALTREWIRLRGEAEKLSRRRSELRQIRRERRRLAEEKLMSVAERAASQQKRLEEETEKMRLAKMEEEEAERQRKQRSPEQEKERIERERRAEREKRQKMTKSVVIDESF